MKPSLFLFLIFLIQIYSQTTFLFQSKYSDCSNSIQAHIYSGCDKIGNYTSVKAFCRKETARISYCSSLKCNEPCSFPEKLSNCFFKDGFFQKIKCGGNLKGGIVQTYTDPLCTKQDTVPSIYLTNTCSSTSNDTSFQYICSNDNGLTIENFNNKDCSGTPLSSKIIFSQECTFDGQKFSKILSCGTYTSLNRPQKNKVESQITPKQVNEPVNSILNFNIGFASLFLLLLCNIL